MKYELRQRSLDLDCILWFYLINFSYIYPFKFKGAKANNEASSVEKNQKIASYALKTQICTFSCKFILPRHARPRFFT